MQTVELFQRVKPRDGLSEILAKSHFEYAVPRPVQVLCNQHILRLGIPRLSRATLGEHQHLTRAVIVLTRRVDSHRHPWIGLAASLMPEADQTDLPLAVPLQELTL